MGSVEFYRPAWDAGADADPVGVCPVCGQAVYQGDRIYWARGTDHAVGCEHCVDEHLA